jgi:hypothetical protein
MSYTSRNYGPGYSSFSAPPNPLGRRVEPLQPGPGTTHVITIPGTSFKCMLTLDDSGLSTPDRGTARYVARPMSVEKLMKDLSARTIPGPGKRRVKCAPVLQTLQEWQESTTTRKAA